MSRSAILEQTRGCVCFCTWCLMPLNHLKCNRFLKNNIFSSNDYWSFSTSQNITILLAKAVTVGCYFSFLFLSHLNPMTHTRFHCYLLWLVWASLGIIMLSGRLVTARMLPKRHSWLRSNGGMAQNDLNNLNQWWPFFLKSNNSLCFIFSDYTADLHHPFKWCFELNVVTFFHQY